MIIIGHGLDVIDTRELAALDEDGQVAWESEIFTYQELREVDQLERSLRLRKLSGKFAAKEAVYKAAGGTPSGEIAWPEIEILAEAGGRPYARYSGTWLVRCQALGVTQFAVSISHAGPLTFGSAIAIADAS